MFLFGEDVGPRLNLLLLKTWGQKISEAHIDTSRALAYLQALRCIRLLDSLLTDIRSDGIPTASQLLQLALAYFMTVESIIFADGTSKSRLRRRD